ncbi:MAG: RecQ family ATP-dependent DNA helicase [Muribaculaceae bacterium]|nr:RecQ family ATP-dependent DNA helicase [Muribaculaceae bacterium]
MDSPEEILERYWGYTSFRPAQREIVGDVLAGRDTIGLLPTGGGKSITFQVPAMMLPGVTLVVTPLISLMKDQVDNLADRGIRAACLHSGLTRREASYAMDRARLGRARIVYVAPEKLRQKNFLAELRSWDVSLIVVDEAHCISQWGYDFRPSYLKIAELRPLFPDAPVLALTASATPEVVADIADKLHMRGHAVHSLSFERRNISFVVRRTPHKEQMLAHVLQRTEGTAIVYVRSRRRTVELADMLAREGITAAYYHAGLDPQLKSERQDAWRSGEVRVIVATNAFGMGIDKPDVRLVVHFDLPSTLEEYYQEAGRAGRDGLPSFAVVLLGPADAATLRRRVAEEFPPKEFVARVYEQLCIYLNVAVDGGYEMVYDLDLRQFCAHYGLPVRPVQSALGLLTRAGYIDYNDEMAMQARVIATVRRDEFYALQLSDVDERVLMALLRGYGGIFADYVHIDEARLATAAGVSQAVFYESMLSLSRQHVLHYVPRRLTPYVYFPYARIETRHIALPREIYDERRRRAEERTEAMIAFASATSECRVRIMLDYFGQPYAPPCGSCDVCRNAAAARRPAPDMRAAVLEAAASGFAVADIGRLWPDHAEAAAEAARTLLDEGLLSSDGITLRAR